jgi:3-hydroxybutyryl-CoA dehydrogenase
MTVPPKARIAVIGAGLMGHGIAQVFALAGHEVRIHDTVMANLDSVTSRILANLRDLGEDESTVERVEPTPHLTRSVMLITLSRPCWRICR